MVLDFIQLTDYYVSWSELKFKEYKMMFFIKYV